MEDVRADGRRRASGGSVRSAQCAVVVAVVEFLKNVDLTTAAHQSP